MTDLQQLLEDVRAGPKGPKVGAFFDFDGTLIAGYSAFAFYEQRLRSFQVSAGEMARSLLAGFEMNLRGADVSKLMRIAVDAWKGHTEDELAELSERLFVQRIAGMVYPEARELVREHRRMGHTVTLASSATRFQAAPLAADLGIDNLLTTSVEVVKGVVTGKLSGPILWGEGKARAVLDFARERELDLTQSYAYGNGDEDVPFLEAVGRPRPLNPQSTLERIARERGWPIGRFRSRGRPGLQEVLRTGAALAGLGSAAAVGLGIGLLNRDRRQAANVAAAIGPDLALALAGVQVNVVGEDHLWSHRPAVFIFNHQSSIDMPVIASLLRRDFTGVAKKEAARDPRFALVGYLGQVAYVDRSDPDQAVAALSGVVERLKEGISIAIAPEGTRSHTPRLGRFKKGAFHMALQGGVPIVPVVIRNAGEIMWKGSFLIRPGSIDVRVLPPVATDDWTEDDLDDRIAAVRQLFLDQLARWSGEDDADGSRPADRPRRAPPATRAGRPAPARARAR
jgi:putative phosphoserine phosphatase / 1-acylglycerol-3-phosphate O-acyltransferase